MSHQAQTTAPFAAQADRAVVVVAAGSGTRLGLGVAKALVPVAGVTMLERALEPLFSLPEPTHVVVVAPPDRIDDVRTIVAAVAGPAAPYAAVVPGGADRHASVEAGLATLPPSVRSVLVHDAARCLTPVAQIERVFDAVAEHGCGVVPALPVTDTVKRVVDDVVLGTVDRSELVGVQTPQGFPLSELREAYGAARRSETDDAGVFQAAGGTVRYVAGDGDAFKVTTPWDLRRAEAIVRERAAERAGELEARGAARLEARGASGLEAREAAPEGRAAAVPSLPSAVRIGLGVDVHAFADDQPCRVGLLSFPGERGLAGHSDGDAVAHAVVDALLSAAGLGDIGGTFGTADPRYAGASGDVFLRGAVELLAEHGWRPSSVTVQVIGNRPRIGSRRVEMQEALGAAVGAPVAVSGTTTDGLGFTGRGEGLAAIATALLHRA